MKIRIHLIIFKFYSLEHELYTTDLNPNMNTFLVKNNSRLNNI